MGTTDFPASGFQGLIGSGRSFAVVFDPRLNALNLIRLLLATGVIVYHSFLTGGFPIISQPVELFIASVFVDGFFAISGFLIVSSWIRDPHWGRFLRARVLRILPAFWICLIITAFVIAPLSQGVWGPANVTYVLKNAALWMFQYDIAGTPLNVPIRGTWDSSLWTLAWEFLCYLGVLALGVVGLLKRSWVIPTLFGLAVLGTIVGTPEIMGDLVVESDTVGYASRFGAMFFAGAMIYQFSHRIRASWLWVAIAAAIIAGATFLPNYRIIAALPVAYVVLTAGALIKRERLRLRNDISYGAYIYAFPMQQVLAIFGASVFGISWFVVLSAALTLPLAIGSWFLIEKPAMKLRRRMTAPLAVSAPSEAKEKGS